MVFNKSPERYPIKNQGIYLAHCGISPLYSQAARRATALIEEQTLNGGSHFMDFYEPILADFKEQAGLLLQTPAENIAAVRNTSEALSMIANGYPFEPGDEIITFEHEYPANFYPWLIQERRGVKVRQIPNLPAREDIDPGLVGIVPYEAIEQLITPRTRIVALSHVQFTSGYAIDLARIGALCKARGIDFIVDVAQSLGSMPVFPESMHISALASAGWKWMLGPMGIGVFYTSPAFREKLAPVIIGAETMTQGFDYLDHGWKPHLTAKRFEYSTSAITHVAALATCLEQNHNHYGIAAIFGEIQRLQDVFLAHFDHPQIKPLVFEGPHRSGILSLAAPEAGKYSQALAAKGIQTTARGGFLRIAPHFYNTDMEMEHAARRVGELRINNTAG
jgi:selenocysteine lyase/cysteine desulfurase